MFTHVVLFWTDPAKPQAARALVDGATRYLSNIPGIVHFHVGEMVGSPREVVDQTYQVGLNVVFSSRHNQDEYQAHRQHQEYVAKVVKPNCQTIKVYDFE